MRSVNDPIEYGIGKRRLADQLKPLNWDRQYSSAETAAFPLIPMTMPYIFQEAGNQVIAGWYDCGKAEEVREVQKGVSNRAGIVRNKALIYYGFQYHGWL